MKISSRAEYGLRAMLELACCSDNKKPLMLQLIAERRAIPVKYLEQLFILLRKAKLIKGQRGPSGGYVLTRTPEDIGLCEVIEALEGPILLASCLRNSQNCVFGEHCALQEVWEKLNDCVRSTLQEISLKDLCTRQMNLSCIIDSLPSAQCEQIHCDVEPVKLVVPSSTAADLLDCPSTKKRSQKNRKKSKTKASKKASEKQITANLEV